MILFSGSAVCHDHLVSSHVEGGPHVFFLSAPLHLSVDLVSVAVEANVVSADKLHFGTCVWLASAAVTLALAVAVVALSFDSVAVSVVSFVGE